MTKRIIEAQSAAKATVPDVPAGPGARAIRASKRADTRALLVRTGVALLTERSFAAVGIEEVLDRSGVARGSFYHFFASKEAFGEAVIDHYGDYFDRKLRRLLEDPSVAPLARLQAYVEEAPRGVEKFDCTRGCLIGALSQELGAHSAVFRPKLEAVFTNWQRHVAGCLRDAIAAGEVDRSLDVDLTAEFFWYGWEGALMRSKLDRSAAPLRRFGLHFIASLPRPDATRRRGPTPIVPSAPLPHPAGTRRRPTAPIASSPRPSAARSRPAPSGAARRGKPA